MYTVFILMLVSANRPGAAHRWIGLGENPLPLPPSPIPHRCSCCTEVSASPLIVRSPSSQINFIQHGGTAGDYQRGLDFLADIVGELPIAEDIVRVAAITFSTVATVQFDFDAFISPTSLQAALRSLPYEAGITNTHLGVEQLRGILQPSNGYRGNSTRLAVVLLTDGSSSQPSRLLTEIAALDAVAASDRYVYMVGLASAPADLLAFAGSSSHLLSADNYTVLSSTLREPTLDIFCTSNCPPAQFESQPCTQFADHVCFPLAVCNTSVEYEIIPPSRSSDRRCTGLRVCDSEGVPQAEYELAASSPTSNRVCVAVQTCISAEFESTPPTPTGNRVCSAVQSCISGFSFESSAPNSTADRQCTPCTRCSGIEFETGQCLTGADRACSFLRNCTASEFEQSIPTATTNRVCTSLSICDSVFQFQDLAPTLTTDRGCAFVTPCNVGEFISANETVTSDRVCATCTACATGQFRGTSCTDFADATCAPCTQTCTLDPIDLVFLVDDSQSIENPIYGGQVSADSPSPQLAFS